VEEGHFRGTPRSRTECRVEVKRLDGDGAAFVTYTSDIGVGGLCLAHCEALRVGERVEVALYAPSRWEPVVLRAEVCWRRDLARDGASETGFRFVDATGDASAAVTELVSALDYEG
jgi:hypothetical protein